jgi:glycosyltransferase involved in cell wall biosynthesis
MRLPVVYSVDHYWLAREVGKDPWLRWWNNPKNSAGRTFARGLLELAGQRSKIDQVAPTRSSKADHRLPQLYAGDGPFTSAQPNSLATFRLEHIYFCSQTVKFATETAGLRVGHGDVIYPGVPTQVFFGEVKPASAATTKFLIVSKLDAQSGALTAIKALRSLRTRGGHATLAIYGRGDSDYMAQIRSEVAAQQLPVEFLPVSNMTKDLPAIYRRHDALLYTAEWNEPF